MTVEQFIQDCKTFGISHYNKCVKQFKAGSKEILYVAQTPQGYNYGGFQKNTTRCHIWTEKTGWTTWFSNLSNHRAAVALAARKNGRINQVQPEVVNNYLTNGYSTRRGLFAEYSNEALDRMGVIARSHADYLGCEVDSTTDHYNRVRMRNN